MMSRQLLVIMLLFGVIMGCGQQSPPIAILDPEASCDEIIHPALLTIPFEELAQDREKAEQWILTEYPTATVEFQPSDKQGGVGYFYWSEDDKGFALTLTQSYRYIYQKTSQYSTLGQILRCYGEPQYYSLGDVANIGDAPSSVRLELWYTDRGIYFQSVTSTIRHYDSGSPIVGIIMVIPPGSVEEMIEYGGINSERYRDAEQASLKEWPDNFTELVLEE